MATINSLMSGNINNNMNVRAVKNEIAELKSKSGEMNSKEYGEKMSGLTEQLQEAKMSAVTMNTSAASGIATLFSYMNNPNSGSNSIWGAGTFDAETFFGGKGALSSLQAMNSARLGIENRARTLSAEIGLDRAKGYDVSAKQEALANLTGNLDILGRNLNSSIDRALSDNKDDKKFINIVDMLRKSMEPKAILENLKTDEAEPVEPPEPAVEPNEAPEPTEPVTEPDLSEQTAPERE
ncbi:MAG: hypothetical protein FWD34_00215 [Oscillospiraceae bacterium]|nr:hypothetical protein [Oscillospiraceae bacterium]